MPTGINSAAVSLGIRLIFLFSLILPAYASGKDKTAETAFPYYPSLVKWEKTEAEFTEPETCGECHPDKYDEWKGSMHFLAFTDPVYRGELKLAIDAAGKDVGRQCEGCHSPAGMVTGETAGTRIDELSEVAKAGVSCDVCHSVKTHTHGETPTRQPENGSFILSPGTDENGEVTLTKYGPLTPDEWCGDDFHQCIKSPLFKESELCASCHQVTHYETHTFLEATYREWRNSLYRINGINCQDCHMVSHETFLTSADQFRKPSDGEHHHYFNGANFLIYSMAEKAALKSGRKELADNYRKKYEASVARLQAASGLEITPVYRKRKLAEIKVRVRNLRAGHNLPTSLNNIRQMWLELTVADKDGNLLSATGRPDKKGELPDDVRIFNTQGMDKDTNFTVNPWEIVAFSKNDTIPPKGFRDVYFSVPQAEGKTAFTITAKLKYRQASPEIVKKLLKHTPESVLIQSTYALTETPVLPVLDMAEKKVVVKTSE